MRSLISSLTAVVLLTDLLLFAQQSPVGKQFRVPPGFVLELAAGAPETVFPMFAVFGDNGRLFVAESSGLDLYKEISGLTRKCRIRLLEDPDNNGRFRKSTLWAEQLVFPMGLAWRDAKLYVADPPDLITLEDSDGDGKADKRTVLLSGFGHRDNGSLHGLVFGPDGWLYLTMGDPDGYTLPRRDKSVVTGATGALLRCRPDGSEVEVLCSGFENLVEIAFTPRGEIIGTDNWFQTPLGGIRDALVHLVPGGRYPRHALKAAPLPFTGEPLPAISLFPAVALSGLLRYQGSAFPVEMHGNLFAAQHNARKVTRHSLMPHGSTLRSQDHDFVATDDPDFHPSDVVEAADGSLYVVDTGSWYVHHCPTGQIRKAPWKGAIYRVRPTKMKTVADPWGLNIAWPKKSPVQLLQLLEDPRPPIRERARCSLSTQGAVALPAIATFVDRPGSRAAQQQALWALAGIPGKQTQKLLKKLLADDQTPGDLRTVAARVAALLPDKECEPELLRLLKLQKAPHLQLAVAEALARCGTRQALPVLWAALRQDPDVFLEHALIHALHFLAEAADLEQALEDLHPRVQKAALILLDQPPRAKNLLRPEVVLKRIASSHGELRQAALGILKKHPEWADQARGLLQHRLASLTLTTEEERGLPSLLLAFQNQQPIQELIAKSLHQGDLPKPRRLLLLETMGETTLAKVPSTWQEVLGSLLRQADPDLRLAAVRVAATLQITGLDDHLATLAENAREPVKLRLEAQRAVMLRRAKLSAAVFDLLVNQLVADADPLLRLAAAEVLGRAQLTEPQLMHLLKVASGPSLIGPQVFVPAFVGSFTEKAGPAFLDYCAHALKTGWRPSETELNLVLKKLPESLQAKAVSLRALWEQHRQKQQARLAEFEPLLQGGDPQRGRQLFSAPKTACATCHRIGPEGGTIGPDLTRIAAVRSSVDILESILLPSSTIAQGFDPLVIQTKTGKTITGIIARKTADLVVLRDPSGAETQLPASQIDEIRPSAVSLMPEGLERNLTSVELRDLLAFLQSLK